MISEQLADGFLIVIIEIRAFGGFGEGRRTLRRVETALWLRRRRHSVSLLRERGRRGMLG